MDLAVLSLAAGGGRGTGVGGSGLRVVGAVDEDRAAGGVRPVTGRIGGHRFERFVGPPGPTPVDREAIRTDGGCWIRLRLV
jgi:hypothetical protein